MDIGQLYEDSNGLMNKHCTIAVFSFLGLTYFIANLFLSSRSMCWTTTNYSSIIITRVLCTLLYFFLFFFSGSTFSFSQSSFEWMLANEFYYVFHISSLTVFNNSSESDDDNGKCKNGSCVCPQGKYDLFLILCQKCLCGTSQVNGHREIVRLEYDASHTNFV